MHDHHPIRGRLRRFAPHLTLAAANLALLVTLLGAVPVRVVEKAATALVLPCGLCWLALGVAVGLAAWQRRRLAWLLAAIWLVYTLAGNGLIGNRILCRLEQPYYQNAPLESPPLDLLVVLGGTTGYLQHGAAQISSGGDRVLLAARLYHRGRSDRLIAAGALMTPTGYDEMGGGRAAAEIWQDLGIPAAAITLIGGRNTLQELRSLRDLLERERTLSGSGQPPESGGPRVGLLTSAWHMPRALRLATQEGLAVVPVPADFATSRPPPSWEAILLGLIPSGSGFQQTDRAVKELLAGIVGR